MANYTNSAYSNLNNLYNILADAITATDLFVTNTATIYNLTVVNSLTFPLSFVWTNLINQASTLLGTNQLTKTNFTGNITQSAGSVQLNDTTLGSITQGNSSVIIQSGTQWNQLKQTQVSDLNVTGTLTLPSNIVVNGSTYNSDLVLNNATIQQTNSSTALINTFGATDFYNGDVRMNDNFTMVGGASTIATLKNLIVQGTSQLGIITGSTISDIYNLIALRAPINNPTFTGTVSGITKSMIGLSNVDNTSDASKPISIATQSSLNNLQTQLNAIVNTPNVQSITIGTVTSVASNIDASITNTGTPTNQILNFSIPKGINGVNGGQGEKGEKGDRGSKGEQGDTGPQGGDGGGEIAGSIAGGISGGISGAAAATAVSTSIATSVATGICAAELAVIQPQITALKTDVAGLQVQVDTLGEGLTQLDNDMILLKGKTQYQNVVGSTTVISSAIETGNIISSGSLYVASDSTIVGKCSATHFTGGLLPTRIDGPVINIGTDEVLFNTVTIGSASTITTINGIVNFSNPFNNFFEQF